MIMIMMSSLDEKKTRKRNIRPGRGFILTIFFPIEMVSLNMNSLLNDQWNIF